MDASLSSPQVKRCLERLAKRRLIGVYIVKTDYFVVQEHRKRSKERMQNVNFLGILPEERSYEYEISAKIDRTVHKAFYFGISSNEVALMDIADASIPVTYVSFESIAEVVVLHRCVDATESLFALSLKEAISDEKYAGSNQLSRVHSCLFKSYRCQELISNLSIAISAANMLRSLRLSSVPLRYSCGGKSDGLATDVNMFMVAPSLIPSENNEDKQSSKSKRKYRLTEEVWESTEEEGASFAHVVPTSGHAVLGHAAYKIPGYRFIFVEGFSLEASSSSLDAVHHVHLFTQGMQLKKTHFTIEVTKPTLIEYEAHALEDVAGRVAKELSANYASSRIRLHSRRVEKKDSSSSDKSQWECVEMHLQVLGSESSAPKSKVGGNGSATYDLGRDVIIMVARRRYLPPNMDLFQDIILTFRAGNRRWHDTEDLLPYPRSIYNSLEPLNFYPNDGVQDILQARADALLLPRRGFLYFRDVFSVQPTHCSQCAKRFIMALIEMLERNEQFILPSDSSRRQLLSYFEDSGFDKSLTLVNRPFGPDPLYHALEMENSAPGLQDDECDITIKMRHSTLSSSSARFEWKRRCWYYLAALIDQGLVPELSLGALVDSYCHLDSRPSAQEELSIIIEHLLYLRKAGEPYHRRLPLVKRLLVWRPEDYANCFFNPHVMVSLLRTKFFKHVFIRQHDPTRSEYIRFIVQLLAWRPHPTMPMMGFDVGELRLLLCHLLATEKGAATEPYYSINSAGNEIGTRDARKRPKHQIEDTGLIADSSTINRHRINTFADLTLNAWLAILNEGSNAVEGTAIVTMHILVELTSSDPADESDAQTASARVVVDRIVENSVAMENISLLLSDGNDSLSELTCHFMRNVLVVKPVMRTALMNLGVLSRILSILVPAERISILMGSFAKRIKETKRRRRLSISPVKPDRKQGKVATALKYNPKPFRDLGLLIEAISLLEVLAADPRIKKNVYDISKFEGMPNLNTYNASVRPAFYVLSLLVCDNMSSVLVPDCESVHVQEASVVPLHVMIFRTLTALCRFNRKNKIAIASSVARDLIRILDKTHNGVLQAAILECMHGIATEFSQLDKSTRATLSQRKVQRLLQRLADNVGDTKVGTRVLQGSSLAKKTEFLIFNVKETKIH